MTDPCRACDHPRDSHGTRYAALHGDHEWVDPGGPPPESVPGPPLIVAHPAGGVTQAATDRYSTGRVPLPPVPEYCVDAERRFVGAWEPIEEWSHFASYGSVAAVCGEPVPSDTPWEKDRGDWALARFTTRRVETTCPKCRHVLGYGRQGGQGR